MVDIPGFSSARSWSGNLAVVIQRLRHFAIERLRHFADSRGGVDRGPPPIDELLLRDDDPRRHWADTFDSSSVRREICDCFCALPLSSRLM